MECLREARTAVRDLRALIRGVKPVSARLESAILAAIGTTYRGGRRSMELAYRTGDAAAFQEWRTAVKYHGHHLRLLGQLWPGDLEGRLGVTQQLADLLDEQGELSRLPADETLMARIGERQAALRAMARPLGRRLFAEPPTDLRRRLQERWRLWRARGETARPAEARAAA
jgi:hypothetical protein